MRSAASILHLDMDAFFASVEQRDKPSLRGKPVIVGGVSGRGVVSTASYEARVYGVHSAMPMHEARRRCPNAAFLSGRFDAYREASRIVMGILGELSPAVEPLSLDEAFVDLELGESIDFSDGALIELGESVRAKVLDQTGLTSSVGMGSSKFMAKVASELAKPNGLYLVSPGTELDTIAELPARAIPGVGPATMDKLSRYGIHTVADIRQMSLPELVRTLGKAGGEGLYALARAEDDRAVHPTREAKSISVEDTFEHDISSVSELEAIIDRDSELVVKRMLRKGLFAKTITLKVRWPDLSHTSRSRTLEGATGSAERVASEARDLLTGLDVSGGIRLLGVGVSGFTDTAQEPLFEIERKAVVEEETTPYVRRPFSWQPGSDVVHDEYGQGWVWGSGLGRVTVRFETRFTPVGRVMTFAIDDPALHPLERASSNPT
ncbi:MAG: DNA polymerase IV [Propionibacteriaceae bacterium]|jgi:DNA polymerase-4|nr:DNA polymerase IV [Propionibacteriaceae bacterium]